MFKINYNIIGKLHYCLNPEAVKALQKHYTPLLKDLNHIPNIYALICSTYPDLNQFDKNVLIAACVYQLYCPASLVGTGCSNSPAGMRRTIADLLGYENGTNLNYWQDKARAFVKGKRFLTKMEPIIGHFKDINKNII